MKKVLIMAAFLFAIFTAQSCFAANYAVYEGFENSIGEAIAYNKNVKLEHAVDGVNGSNGCLKATANSAFVFKYPIAYVPGTTYKISFWVKYTQTKPNQFTYLGGSTTSDKTDASMGAESPNRQYPQVTLNEWYYMEHTFTTISETINNEQCIVFRMFHSNQSSSLQDEVIYIDDLCIEPIVVPDGAPKVTEFSVSEPLYSDIDVKWNCTSSGKSNKVVVFANKGEGRFIAYTGDVKKDIFVPGKSLNGAALEFSVVPINDDCAGLVYTYKVQEPVMLAFEAKKKMVGTVNDEKISASVEIASRTEAKDVLVMLCVYDVDNTMIGMVEKYQAFEKGDVDTIDEIEIEVPDDADYAELFVWEGKSSLDTTLKILD